MRAVHLIGGVMAACAMAASGAADAKSKRRDREKMAVEDVLATSDGHFVVVLKTKNRPLRLLPIWVGETEAMQIRMQLDRRQPPRPLTLNLLQDVLSSSNIKIVEANIDAVKGGVFLGKLRLRQHGRVWEIDARPSDAVGLAVGSGATIWASKRVLIDAAVDPAELDTRERRPKQRRPREELPKTTEYEQTL
jgi:bifunctional DNase/RNase